MIRNDKGTTWVVCYSLRNDNFGFFIQNPYSRKSWKVAIPKSLKIVDFRPSAFVNKNCENT